MYSYSSNWMGPLNKEWIEEHGEQWSGGRIDIYHPSFSYNDETGLPIMRNEDYRMFSLWLRDFVSEEQMNFDELREEYEKFNPKLRVFKELQ